MDAVGVKFPLHFWHLPKRKRCLVRLCFACTEVAVFDNTTDLRLSLV